MSERLPINDHQKALRPGHSGVSLCGAAQPSLMELAAYIDGTSATNQRQMVEHHLSQCEACRSACEDLRQLRRQQPPQCLLPVPPGVLEAAMRLVEPARQEQVVGQRAAISFFSAAPRMVLLRRAAAIAAAVSICAGGYQVGARLPAHAWQAADGTDIDAALSFGLFGSAADLESPIDPLGLEFPEEQS